MYLATLVISFTAAIMASRKRFYVSQSLCDTQPTVSFLPECRSLAHQQTIGAGLVGHLKTHARDMHRFHSILHARKSGPSAEEIEIAEGHKTFANRAEFVKYLDSLNSLVERQQTLRESLMRSAESKVVSFLYL